MTKIEQNLNKIWSKLDKIWIKFEQNLNKISSWFEQNFVKIWKRIAQNRKIENIWMNWSNWSFFGLWNFEQIHFAWWNSNYVFWIVKFWSNSFCMMEFKWSLIFLVEFKWNLFCMMKSIWNDCARIDVRSLKFWILKLVSTLGCTVLAQIWKVRSYIWILGLLGEKLAQEEGLSL